MSKEASGQELRERGTAYYHGHSVEQDYGQAVHWWRLAVAYGNEDAVEVVDKFSSDDAQKFERAVFEQNQKAYQQKDRVTETQRKSVLPFPESRSDQILEFFEAQHQQLRNFTIEKLGTKNAYPIFKRVYRELSIFDRSQKKRK